MSDVKTIARECAEKIWQIHGGPIYPGLYESYAKVFESAIERALRETPVPGPLSDARLTKIVDTMDGLDGMSMESWCLLKEHLVFQARLIQDMASDGKLDIYRAGMRAGAEMQREECHHAAANAVYSVRQRTIAKRMWIAVEVAEAVKSATLVTDKE